MDNLLDNLNPEQKLAVTHENGPLLIVAGAGTGKTTVVTQRISYLINSGKCRPEEILALTFTDKAAGEMEERVDKLMPYGYVDLWISTFHSFAERILRDHGLDIGLPADFKLLSGTEQWLMLRKNLKRFDLDYYRPLGNPTKFIHALLKLFSRAKDENISPEDYLKYAEELKNSDDSADLIKKLKIPKGDKLSDKELKALLDEETWKQMEIAKAYQTYQQLLLENSALDFGDLINYCLKLFKTRANILEIYRQQFKYLLVDEFQDTNYAQYELIKLLAAPQNNITVVGDDDQSVYKFRGASISNILQFKDDYPDCQEIFLTQNYRSRQNILNLSYQFIQKNNPYRLEAKLAELSDKNLSKKLISPLEGLGEIEHLHLATLEEEAVTIAQKIISLYNKEEEASWSDFAILVRANSSADDFTYILEQAKIPYQFIASRGLYGTKIVMDILAYLKVLDSYHESPAMYRVLTLPSWSLSERDIINLNYWARRKSWSLFEACHQAEALEYLSPEGQEKIKKILELIAKQSQSVMTGRNATEIIQLFLNESGYLKLLVDQENIANREQLNYLNQFYKKIQKFEKDSQQRGVKNFLEQINLELEAGEEGSLSANTEDSSPDTVKIMTIHASKGLEFKHVFIVGMVDKRFPSIERHDAIELPENLTKEKSVPEGDVHLQEERRLFYVAMTRAKHGLYLTSADDYGGARKKKISRFLVELTECGLTLSPKVEAPTETEEIKTKEVTEKTKPDVQMPAKFSFTQIKAFENCPYQYRFAHILKIPTAGKPQFSFGKSIHATMQKLFLEIAHNKSKPAEEQGITWEKLLEIYRESFIEDWYPDKETREDYFEKGRAAMKVFFEKYNNNWPRVKNLEFPFNMRVGSNPVYTFYGIIDRIDSMGEGIKIVDYKTGNAKDKLTAEDKEQLLIYQIAAEEAMGVKVEELAFYYVEDNKEMSFVGEQKDLIKLKEKILAIIEEIKKGEFPAKPSILCQWCDFASICDFKSK